MASPLRKRYPVKARLLVVVLAGLAWGWLPTPAIAQQRIVINGSVQWIDGSKMQVMADSGYSINVSLDRVAQDEYNTIRGGDRVRVYGFVPPDRRRVIAERIEVVPTPTTTTARPLRRLKIMGPRQAPPPSSPRARECPGGPRDHAASRGLHDQGGSFGNEHREPAPLSFGIASGDPSVLSMRLFRYLQDRCSTTSDVAR